MRSCCFWRMFPVNGRMGFANEKLSSGQGSNSFYLCFRRDVAQSYVAAGIRLVSGGDTNTHTHTHTLRAEATRVANNYYDKIAQSNWLIQYSFAQLALSGLKSEDWSTVRLLLPHALTCDSWICGAAISTTSRSYFDDLCALAVLCASACQSTTVLNH